MRRLLLVIISMCGFFSIRSDAFFFHCTVSLSAYLTKPFQYLQFYRLPVTLTAMVNRKDLIYVGMYVCVHSSGNALEDSRMNP